MKDIEYFKNKIMQGDCLKIIKNIPPNSIDTILTDPPYGLEFMNKKWDKFPLQDRGKRLTGSGKPTEARGFAKNVAYGYSKESLSAYQEFSYKWAKEALRVAKPGTTLLCFGSPRTYHRMACGIEDAGWIIKDCIMWIYGSGFPKASDMAKNLDKIAGKEIENKSEFTEFSKQTDTTKHIKRYKRCKECGKLLYGQDPCKCEWRDYKGQSEEAKLWKGYKSHGLKPAYEPILIAMKPNEGSYAENALKYGVAGLNIDGGRIPINKEKEKDSRVGTDRVRGDKRGLKSKSIFGCTEKGVQMYKEEGRYPANVILECTCDKVKKGKDEKVSIHDAPKGTFAGGEQNRGSIKNYRERKVGETIIHTNPECPCYMLDKQSGDRKGWSSQKHNKFNPYSGNALLKSGTQREGFYEGFNDIGGASRFFYCAKASKAERNMGCEGLEKKHKRRDDGQPYGMNTNKFRPNGTERKEVKSQTNFHPTVKPLALMEYLCLLTKIPTGGIVLDPFAGSGTTGIACKKIGRDYILIEKEEGYCEIAKRRIKVQMKPLF